MLDMLVTDLNKLCDELPFHTGWYLKNLCTGNTAHRNGHVVVPSASTRKIAIMMTTLKAVHEGKLALDQPVTIQAKYQDNDSGCFQHLQPGFTIQLRDVLVMMIIISDNTCTGTVVDMVGLDAINALSQAVGMRGTTHRYGIPPAGMAGYRPAPETNATTPADVGLLLERILQGSQDPAVATHLGSTPALCQLALDILSWQRLRNRLPARLPLGTKVAHKTGTTARNYNDAGIIYQGNQPLFILSAYTDEVPLDLPAGPPGHTVPTTLTPRMIGPVNTPLAPKRRARLVAPPVWRGESTLQLAHAPWQSPQNVKRLPTADGVTTDSPNVFNRAHRARHPVQWAGMICCSANCCRCAMVSGISRSIAAPARCKPPSTPYSGTSGNTSRAFSRTLTMPACEHELKTMSPFPFTLTAT